MPNFTESVFRGVKQGEELMQTPNRSRAQQLLVKSAELGIDQKQAELDRFSEESNLRSMVQGALEFQQIDPNDNQAQIQFLQNRAEEINDRGGDPRDTLELIQMPMSQRPAVIDSVLSIGKQKGLIQDPTPQKLSKVKTFQKGLTDAGIDPQSKEGIQAIKDFALNKRSPLVAISPDGKQLTRSQKETDEFIKADISEFKELRKSANASSKILSRLNIMKNFKIKTGALEPIKARFAGVVSGLGFPEFAKSIGDAPSAEALQSLSTQLVNTVLNSAKGPQTDQDAARAFETVAKLGDTEQAFEWKLKMFSALEQMNVNKFKFIDAQRKKGVLIQDAFGAWEQESQANPILSKQNSKETGLPLFFEDFEKLMRANPNNKGASKADIMEAWIGSNQ
jgi:hypothetical protein